MLDAYQRGHVAALGVLVVVREHGPLLDLLGERVLANQVCVRAVNGVNGCE